MTHTRHKIEGSKVMRPSTTLKNNQNQEKMRVKQI